MSKKTENKKKDQLGMAQGTARNKLVKLIMFDLIKKLGLNFCYQCAAEISDINTLSIEHKKPWLDSENPKELYFDLDNISFSHYSCNVGAARPRKMNHPSWNSYKEGCRCSECTDINTKKVKYFRDKRKKKQ